MTTNNKYIIIYNNFFMAEPSSPEEEKNIFSKLFFLKKAADPAGEVERFLSYNQANGWKSKDGRVYETFEQRIGLAGLWKFDSGEAEGTRRRYIEAIGSLADEAAKNEVPDVEVMVNPRHDIKWVQKDNRWYWSITEEAYRWIYKSEKNAELVHRHLDPIFNSIPVTFKQIN